MTIHHAILNRQKLLILGKISLSLLAVRVWPIIISLSLLGVLRLPDA